MLHNFYVELLVVLVVYSRRVVDSSVCVVQVIESGQCMGL